jgi:hypothetical protein
MSQVERDDAAFTDAFGSVHAPASLDAWRQRPAPVIHDPRSRLVPLAAVAAVAVVAAGLGTFVGLRVQQTTTTTTVVPAAPAGPPPSARAAAALAYDSATHSLVMFGGWGAVGALNDTWTWNGSAWKQEHPAVSPPARAGALMAFDTRSGELVLFGGVPQTGSPAPSSLCLIGGGGAFSAADCLLAGAQSTGVLSDTWLWDGRTWHQARSSSDLLFNPATERIASDPRTGQVVLVAFCPAIPLGNPAKLPCPSSVPNPATWIWDGNQWSVSSQSAPVEWTTSQGNEGLVADPSGQLTYFSEDLAPQAGRSASASSTASVWTASGWQTIPVGGGPRYANGLFAATPDQRTVFVGIDGATWAWKSGWSQLATGASPAFGLGAMAFDAATNQTVFFGGEASSSANSLSLNNITWTWDGSTWTQHGGAPGSSNASHIGASASSP